MSAASETTGIVGTLIGGLGFLAVFIFDLYCTYICFAGGTIPILNWEMEGSFIGGVAWLFLGSAILFGIAVIPIALVGACIGYLGSIVSNNNEQKP